MKGSLKIGKITGIEISIHYTWIFAFFLFGFSLAQTFQQLFAWSSSKSWMAGFICTVLLFISVLLHELAHSLVAKSRGLPVSSITLFIFGGVSNLSEEPQTPGIEFSMAIVGPLTSVVIGIVCWFVWWALTGTWRLPLLMTVPLGKITLLSAMLGVLAYMNLALAAFNLLPGFPLDGGRVFRSIVWGISKNVDTATNVAATVGQVFGWAFIAGGTYYLFFVPGGLLSGIWIAIIGLFLSSAAQNSRREVSIRAHLAGVKVAQVMETNIDTVGPRMSVADLVHDIFLTGRRRAIPVADSEQIIGMVSISDVRGIAQDMWTMTQVEQIMKKGPVHTLKPDDALSDALKIITQFDINQLPVIDHGKLIGIVNRANIVNYLQLKSDLNAGGGWWKRNDASKPPPTPR